MTWGGRRCLRFGHGMTVGRGDSACALSAGGHGGRGSALLAAIPHPSPTVIPDLIRNPILHSRTIKKKCTELSMRSRVGARDDRHTKGMTGGREAETCGAGTNFLKDVTVMRRDRINFLIDVTVTRRDNATFLIGVTVTRRAGAVFPKVLLSRIWAGACERQTQPFHRCAYNGRRFLLFGGHGDERDQHLFHRDAAVLEGVLVI